MIEYIYNGFIPLLVLILLLINWIFSPNYPYLEKNSVFECGFHSFLWQNRNQFTVSFFIFGLLFLLFDLEILLAFPYLLSNEVNETYGLVIVATFFIFLTLGLHYELGKKALELHSKQSSNTVKGKKKRTFNSLPLNIEINNIKHFSSITNSKTMIEHSRHNLLSSVIGNNKVLSNKFSTNSIIQNYSYNYSYYLITSIRIHIFEHLNIYNLLLAIVICIFMKFDLVYFLDFLKNFVENYDHLTLLMNNNQPGQGSSGGNNTGGNPTPGNGPPGGDSRITIASLLNFERNSKSPVNENTSNSSNVGSGRVAVSSSDDPGVGSSTGVGNSSGVGSSTGVPFDPSSIDSAIARGYIDPSTNLPYKDDITKSAANLIADKLKNSQFSPPINGEWTSYLTELVEDNVITKEERDFAMQAKYGVHDFAANKYNKWYLTKNTDQLIKTLRNGK